MSRCFPFPPPGYEKKLNIDDANLLAKAKHKEKKEKKHKKDKKDKEKKEGKEKDKDRSKEKRGEKKKKEKHRDNNLEKNNFADDKRIEGDVGSSLWSNHFAEVSHVQELANRIKDDAATGSKTVVRNTVTTQKQDESLGRVAAISFISRSERREMFKDKNANRKDTDEQRGNYESGTERVAVAHSFGVMEQNRVDMVKLIEKDVTKTVEGKETEKPYGSSSKGDGSSSKGDKNKDKDEKKVNRQLLHSNGNNFGSNRLQNCQSKENGFWQEFGGRIMDAHAAPKSHFVEKNIGTDQKRAGSVGEKKVGTNQKREGSVGKMVESNIISEGKGVSFKGNGGYSIPNGQGNKARCPKVSFVHNLSKVSCDSMEKGIKRTADGKEKSQQEGLDSTLDGDWGGKHKPKGTYSITERPEGKVREAWEPNKMLFRTNEIVRETEDGSKSCFLKDNKKISFPEGSSKKRKQPEMNGFLHDNEIRPNKLQRPPSCHPPTKNGRKLDEAISNARLIPKGKGNAINHRIQEKEDKLNGVKDPWRSAVKLTVSPSHNHRFSASSIIPQSALKEKETAINHELAGEAKINGFLDPRQSTVNLAISSSAAPKPEKSHKAPSVKRPHPDTRYLSQIFSVPQMEDWAEVDTQDWLFNGDSFSSKNPEAGVSGAETQLQVWEKALHLESAGISALPYVIPY